MVADVTAVIYACNAATNVTLVEEDGRPVYGIYQFGRHTSHHIIIMRCLYLSGILMCPFFKCTRMVVKPLYRKETLRIKRCMLDFHNI